MSQLPDLPPIPALPSEQSISREWPSEQLSAAPIVRESDIRLPEIPQVGSESQAGFGDGGDNRPVGEKLDELLTMMREIKDKLESGEYFKLG